MDSLKVHSYGQRKLKTESANDEWGKFIVEQAVIHDQLDKKA